MDLIIIIFLRYIRKGNTHKKKLKDVESVIIKLITLKILILSG